jgi:Cys-tRNA(Pro)/Cys-tRNA(Cys) deacylase
MACMSAHGTRAIDAVRRAGVAHTVHEYAHDPHAIRDAGGPGYALEAVAALGLAPARVLKTIVVEADGRPTLAVVPSDAEVDLKAVAAALGCRRATVAPPGDAERATGYVVGGISPLGTRRAMATVLDRTAADHATVHVSAGRRGLELELAPGDLAALTGAVVAPIARRR